MDKGHRPIARNWTNCVLTAHFAECLQRRMVDVPLQRLIEWVENLIEPLFF
jgi:uncharacterized membrane protein